MVEEFHDAFEEFTEVVAVPIPEDMSIKRTCFQQSCVSALGHTECGFEKMACERESTWTMLQTDAGTKLMSSKTVQHIPGMLDVVQHKNKLNPRGIITMKGVPAEAPPKLLRAMKEQNALLQKVRALEAEAAKMDPLQKHQRLQWIHLAKGVQHMAPGPAKLKSIHLLMNLAHNIAIHEVELRKQAQLQEKAKPTQKTSVKSKAKKQVTKRVAEPEQAVKVVQKKKMLEKKIRAMGGKALLRKVQRAAFKKIFPNLKIPKHAKAQDSKHKPDMIDGIPVSHKKCFERACVHREKNGVCGAMVISCGRGNKKPPRPDRALINKDSALKKIKNLVPVKSPIKNLLKKAKAAQPKQLQTSEAKK